MPESSSANFKLLTVPAESAHAARRQPAVREATDEGWQIRDIWPSALAAPGQAEPPAAEASAEEAEDGEGERDGAAPPETILYMVRLRRGKVGSRGGLSRLRAVLEQYGLTTAGALAVVALVSLLAFLLLDASLSGPDDRLAMNEVQPPSDRSPSDRSPSDRSPSDRSPSDSATSALRSRAGQQPSGESSFASARAPEEPAATSSPASASAPEASSPARSSTPSTAQNEASTGAASSTNSPTRSSANAAPREPEATSGSLRLTSDPAGATVQLDGRTVGQTPVRVTNIPAGSHTVLLQADGYEPHRRRVTVRAARTATVGTPLAPMTGTLTVLVRPWGTIYVDGEVREREADVRYTTTLPVGRHRIAVVHPELGRWEKTVHLEADAEEALTVNFNQRSTDAAPSASR